MRVLYANSLSEDLRLPRIGREECVPERRRMPRYQVDWQFRVKGTDPTGLGFLNTGRLRDISARGAFGYIGRPLAVGVKMEVSIRLPMKDEVWIKYSAEIIRVEQAGSQIGVAFKFDTARPQFYSK